MSQPTHANRLAQIAKRATNTDPNNYHTKAQSVLEYATIEAGKGYMVLMIDRFHELYSYFPTDTNKYKEFTSILENAPYGFGVRDMNQSYSDPIDAYRIQWSNN